MPLKLKRLIAAVIDFYIICMASSYTVAIATLGEMQVSVYSLLVFFISIFAFAIFKDKVFKNASIGKRIFRICIYQNGVRSLSIFACIKRTITLLILPIEIIFIVTNNKRIGDIWASTYVCNERLADDFMSSDKTSE